MEGTTYLRRTRRALGIVLGAAALLAPAAAQASDIVPEQAFAVGSPAWTTAWDTAVAQWGGTAPCGGQVALRWTSMPDATTNAAASWKNPFSAYERPDANLDCQIVFNSAMWFDWEKFCTVMVHEVGHLMGRAHSPVDTDVMAAIYTVPAPACRALPDPTASPAAAAAQTAGAAGQPVSRTAPAAKKPVSGTAVRRAAAKRAAARRAAAKRSAARRARARRAQARRAVARAAVDHGDTYVSVHVH